MAASTWPQVIQRDLESTGRFKGMARNDMVFKPTTAAEVDAAGWKQQRNDYVVVGRVSALADGQVRIDAELVNVLTGQRIAGPYSHCTGRQPAQWRASHRRCAVRKDHRRQGRVRHAHRLRVRGRQTADAALRTVRGRFRWRQPRAHPGLAAAHHVAGLVAGWRVAGLRVVRAARLGHFRPASAYRKEDHGVGARRHQRRALVFARWQEARDHAVGQQRQPRCLSTGARHGPAHAAHRRSGHRHRSGHVASMAPSTSPRIAPALRRSTA